MRDLQINDRIHCRNWKDLQETVRDLVDEGYHIEVRGWESMMNNVITITKIPGGEEDGSKKLQGV